MERHIICGVRDSESKVARNARKRNARTRAEWGKICNERGCVLCEVRGCTTQDKVRERRKMPPQGLGGERAW